MISHKRFVQENKVFSSWKKEDGKCKKRWFHAIYIFFFLSIYGIIITSKTNGKWCVSLSNQSNGTDKNNETTTQLVAMLQEQMSGNDDYKRYNPWFYWVCEVLKVILTPFWLIFSEIIVIWDIISLKKRPKSKNLDIKMP